MTANRRAMLLMLAFVSLWAVIEAMAGHVLHHYSPYQVVWTRYAVHLGLMLAVWGWRQPRTLWQTQRPLFQVSRSLLMLGMPAAWIVGQQMGLDSMTLMSVFWLSPLFILGLARMFLREGVPWSIWVVTAMACLGAMLMHEPGRPSRLALLVFPLGMAMCFSLYVVMTRSLRSDSTRTNLFYTALGVFAVLTPFMPGVWVTPHGSDLLAMVGVGVLGFAALYMLDRMAEAAPVGVSAPFAYVQLVATAGLALVAGMGHDMSWRRTGLGMMLIAAAAFYVWVREPHLKVSDALAAQPSS